MRVITGREGGEDANPGDQVNVAGSHLGTYELYLTKDFRQFDLGFIYNHFFEDGTGSRYANFPDGRYGIYYERKEKTSLINSAIYEFYYTRNQSINSSAPHKQDQYFNNFLTYESGWTYQQRILGVPFFDYDKEKGYIVGNKFLAHHIGIAGIFSSYFYSYPYKLLISHVHKEGAYFRYYVPDREELYVNYEMGLLKEPFNLNILLGTEFSNVAKPVFGAGISLSKHF